MPGISRQSDCRRTQFPVDRHHARGYEAPRREGWTPNLRPVFRLCVRMNGNFIIAISSNYRFLKDRRTITQERIGTLDKYLKEQGITQDSLGWHLDYENHRWRPL